MMRATPILTALRMLAATRPALAPVQAIDAPHVNKLLDSDD